MIKSFKNAFKNDDSKFIVEIGIKFLLISLIVFLFIIFTFWTLLRMDNLFLEANGLVSSAELRDAYYDFVLANTIKWMPAFLFFLIMLFTFGAYLGWIILRPFRTLSDYTERLVAGDFNVDEEVYTNNFSNFSLLKGFSDFFFEWSKQKIKKLNKEVIFPSQYLKIHAPVFDGIFFLHFSLIVLIMTVITATALRVITVEIHSSIVELSINIIKVKSASIRLFLDGQKEVISYMMSGSIVFLVFAYASFAFHLYSKVSGAAFGFFATMRSFIKGSYDTRVHLIGYSHIRPYSRKFNKFLDHLQKNIG